MTAAQNFDQAGPAFDNVRYYLTGARASGDLTAEMHKFMVVDSTGRIARAVLNSRAVGVLENKAGIAGDAVASAGQSCSVSIVPSLTKVLVGAAAVVAGAPVSSDANGLAVTASTAGTDIVLGLALTSGQPGSLISVQLMPSGKL